jgi:hypothetical protein
MDENESVDGCEVTYVEKHRLCGWCVGYMHPDSCKYRVIQWHRTRMENGINTLEFFLGGDWDR